VRAAERTRRRPRIGLILAVLVPALAAGAAVLAMAPGERVTGLSGDARALARQAAIGRDLGSHTTRALEPIVAVRGRSGVRPSDLEPLAGGVRPAVPDHIWIPAAGVDTVVDSVGLKRDGTIEVPGLGRGGWYDGGARPGEPGRAVIIGHLDTGRGPGVFARVPGLQPGQQIDVIDRRGDEYRYEVVGRAQVAKDRFPVSEVYGGDGRPVLVLVTCGGPYIQGQGYRDNVLVYAKAV
jgi:Sortase domain